MLLIMKDVDLFWGLNVYEIELNVVENGGFRKKCRLSNIVRNGMCIVVSDFL